MDSTSLTTPPIDVSQLKNGTLKGKRFALPRELFGAGIAKGVADCVLKAVDVISAEGAICEEIDLPSIKYGVTTYYIIAPAEASSNLARYDGVRYGLRVEGEGHIGMTERTRAQGFGHEVKSRIMIGTYALSAGYYDAYYLRAQQVRGLMQRELAAAFESYDAILSPSSPVVAFKLGALTGDPMALKLLDLCTIPANMGGNPAISLPCGLSDGLPVGLQLMGPVLSDEGILQTAWCVEQVLGAAPRPPIP
jgi:aspartyl-tRNA(Asn)/glutamyl-tRNA(Gln) amidotransferase subunit A